LRKQILFTQKYSSFYTFSFHQANVETGRSVHQIPCKAAMNSVEWNPKYNLLAYAGDDKNKYADEGMVAAVQSFSLACTKKCRKRVKTTPVNSWAILL